MVWTYHEIKQNSDFLEQPELRQIITLRNNKEYTYFRIKEQNLKYRIPIKDQVKGRSTWFYYPPCSETSQAAYFNRHKPVQLPEYDPQLNKKLGRHLRKFIHKINKPWTEDQYIDSITNTTKKKAYQEILNWMRKTGKIISLVQPFTKIEKMQLSKYKAPRMIQGRHFSFNIAYGKYIKPLEKMVSKYSKKSSKYFGKGDYDTQAAKILEMASKYNYYTECDHTTFDAHVTVEHLKVTHQFYKQCYPTEYHHELTKLSKRTIRNTCISRTGDRYTVKGTRMSGDVDTGFGNCLINYAIIKDILEKMKIKGEVIVNGDDSIIFTNTEINQIEFEQHCRKYNMETKCNKSETNIHKVEFCRTKLIFNAEGVPTMMIKPTRLTDIYGMEYNISKKNYHQYLTETALCNTLINANNPVGAIWAKTFNINIFNHINYKEKEKKEKKIEKILIKLDMLEHSKRMKMLNLTPNQASTAEITQSCLAAWPEIMEYEKEVKKIYNIYNQHKYKYDNYLIKAIINHDNQTYILE